MSRLSHRGPWKHIWIGVEKRGCLHSPGKLGRPPCSWACRRWSPCSPLADSSWWTTHQYFPQPNLNLLPDRVSKGHGCINAHPIIFASSRPSGKGARAGQIEQLWCHSENGAASSEFRLGSVAARRAPVVRRGGCGGWRGPWGRVGGPARTNWQCL